MEAHAVLARGRACALDETRAQGGILAGRMHASTAGGRLRWLAPTDPIPRALIGG